MNAGMTTERGEHTTPPPHPEEAAKARRAKAGVSKDEAATARRTFIFFDAILTDRSLVRDARLRATRFGALLTMRL